MHHPHTHPPRPTSHLRLDLGLVEALSNQFHNAAQLLHRVDLNLGAVGGHADDRLAAERARRKRHTLWDGRQKRAKCLLLVGMQITALQPRVRAASATP